MKFTRLEIPDVLLIEPKIFSDARGFFYESYHMKVFAEAGIVAPFVQDNQGCSSRGVLRGLHYQIEPMAQAKLVRVTRGEAFDVAVDIRKGSKTFGKFVTAILSGENKKMLYIPAGFAHGYCALTDGTEFLYKVTEFYSPQHERGILWKDPDIGIPWPETEGEYILSEKDRKYPLLRDVPAV